MFIGLVVLLISTGPIAGFLSRGALFVDEDYNEFSCRRPSIARPMMSLKIKNKFSRQLPLTIAREHLEICQKVPELTVICRDVLVEDIADDAFEDMQQIKFLSIISNNFNRVRFTPFENLTGLYYLRLSLQYTRIVDPEIFRVSDNLTVLSLTIDHPKLEAGFLSGLNVTKLYVTRCKITEIELGALSDMPNLEILQLSDNRLGDFNANEVLQNTNGITDLYLDYNRITHVSKYLVEGLLSLKIVDLKYNRISTFDKDVFGNNPLIETINLAHNNIEILPLKTFSKVPLTNIKLLDLSYNRLYYLSPLVLAEFPKLNATRIIGNPWKCPCLDMFRSTLVELEIKELCVAEFYDGSLPDCVVPSPGDMLCFSFGQKRNQDQYRRYRNHTRDTECVDTAFGVITLD